MFLKLEYRTSNLCAELLQYYMLQPDVLSQSSIPYQRNNHIGRLPSVVSQRTHKTSQCLPQVTQHLKIRTRRTEYHSQCYVQRFKAQHRPRSSSAEIPDIDSISASSRIGLSISCPAESNTPAGMSLYESAEINTDT